MISAGQIAGFARNSEGPSCCSGFGSFRAGEGEILGCLALSRHSKSATGEAGEQKSEGLSCSTLSH